MTTGLAGEVAIGPAGEVTTGDGTTGSGRDSTGPQFPRAGSKRHSFFPF